MGRKKVLENDRQSATKKKSAVFWLVEKTDSWRKMRLCVASVIGKIKTKEFLGKLWRKYLSVGVKAGAQKGEQAAKSIWAPEEIY